MKLPAIETALSEEIRKRFDRCSGLADQVRRDNPESEALNMVFGLISGIRKDQSAYRRHGENELSTRTDWIQRTLALIDTFLDEFEEKINRGEPAF